ncbi:serine hydrolase domain-containing protein [Christiangramia echinicola]|uniref:serine hydrolase domain-containing protein n=1 Tax=Christiangramia echinicola TaxID=279359 RepID=UPI0004241F57|nr:serine hydrolase domain-containing protein [Christiangramia echinicola]
MKIYTSNSFRTLYLLLILPAFIFLGFSQNSVKAEKIDELISKYEEYKQFNGSLLVAEKGEVILKKGYGLANMEWNIPNGTDTKHRVGSITKQFTSMLIMQLVEENKLELDKPITTYLKDYPKETGDQISIHHLLSHTSGIPNMTSFPGFFEDMSRDPYSVRELTGVFADSSLVFKPGEKFAYSNSGYILLGAIIEEATGKPYEEVLHERILDPLNMKDTGYDNFEKIIKNRSTGYEQRGSKFTNSKYLDMSIPYAAGSIYSTVEDLYKWHKALLNNDLISQESKDIMFTAHKKLGSQASAYGWFVGDQKFGQVNDSVFTTVHSGGINGYNALITRIPEDDALIVLLNNTGGKPLNDMTEAIGRILYDEDYKMPKRSLVVAMMEEFYDNGLAAANEFYAKNKDSEEFELNEGEMNSFGYELLRNQKTDAAIKIFKLNVIAFPESGNVYDSLAEAYLEKGDKKLALKNYQRSVEIDPSITNAVQIIKNLQEGTE